MKTFLFEGKGDLKPHEIIDSLESDNCGVEECHTFVKTFTEEELIESEQLFMEKSKELSSLIRELEALSSPLKAKMKPLKKETHMLITSLNKGGTDVTEKVYCYPDYENKIMGLYDSRGYLIGTRPMSRAERQLHINSFLNKAI